MYDTDGRNVHPYTPTSLTPFLVPHYGLHSAATITNIGLVKYVFHGQPINSILDGVLPLHTVLSGWNNIMKDWLGGHQSAPN
jgi:hypothetical protein